MIGIKAGAVALAFSTGLAAGAAFADGGDTLAFAGRIDPALRYRVRVDYATSVNDRACQVDDYITGMWIPQLESRFEAPTIAGATHGFTTPLARPSGTGACAWTPKVVFLCLGPRTAADDALACKALMMFTPVGEDPPAAVALTCDAAVGACVDAGGRDPARQVRALTGPIQLDVAAGSLRPGA